MRVRALLSFLPLFLAATAAAERGSGYVDLLTPATAAAYKAQLPLVDDTDLDALLRSPETMWYDEKAIVPGYQDSMGDPVGFRPNTIDKQLINLAVPGGWEKLFQRKGRFNFPFATGGADNSDNFTKVNFWSVPRQNGKALPVVYWRLNWTRYRWLFPVGTRFGEVMFVTFPDGEKRVFEIRVRRRELTHWANEVYRPFPTAEHLVTAIQVARPDWFRKPALMQLVEQVGDESTLTPGKLETRFFPGTFPTLQGSLDVLPDIDAALAKQLLQTTRFRRVGTTPWKANGNKVSYAPSAKTHASVVPFQYEAGLLRGDDATCKRCHQDAARQIQDFYPAMVLYGELWGEDETFSWHPFETSMFVDAQGNVKNFNNDNRRLRQDMVNAGLLEAYKPATHSGSVYKELPHEWRYDPVRTTGAYAEPRQ